MKRIEWLKSLGYDVDAHRLTEQECRDLSKPLEEPDCPLMETVRRIVVHHSATDSGSAALFRLLHRAVNGWSDVGYHFVIGNGNGSPDGHVEKGRKLPYRGAHARGGNEDSIGICLVGNFNTGKPTALQMESLGRLLTKLMEQYSIEPSGISIHRLVKGSSTQCPGRNLRLEDVLLLVEE